MGSLNGGGIKCPICHGKSVHSVVIRHDMPIHQNVLYKNESEAKKCVTSDLDFVICEHCGFVFNAAFDPSLDLYDESYDNMQSASEIFSSYMDSSIDYYEKKYNHSPSKIIEIGCGCKAEYLQRVYEKFPGVIACGYDPSCTAELNGVEIYKKYFDFKDDRCESADWIISRHVIEHIQNPTLMMMNALGLSDDEKAVMFIETPDVRWIFKNNVIFDFFHEHCSLLSPSSFYVMARECGVNISEIREAFKGQYQWIFIKKRESDDSSDKIRIALDDVIFLSEKYRRNEVAIFDKLSKYVDSHSGNVAIWGAGAKGNTFCNLFDKDRSRIICVIDTDEKKANKYVASTAHKVLSPKEALKNKDIKYILVLNPNYYHEIVSHYDLNGLEVVTQDMI